jgi:hypothetical protein
MPAGDCGAVRRQVRRRPWQGRCRAVGDKRLLSNRREGRQCLFDVKAFDDAGILSQAFLALDEIES